MTQTIASQKPYEAERDTASPNRNLAPVTTCLDERDRLMVGGCLLSDLAQRYGTPLRPDKPQPASLRRYYAGR